MFPKTTLFVAENALFFAFAEDVFDKWEQTPTTGVKNMRINIPPR